MTVLMGPEPNVAHCSECGQVFAKPELPMPLDAFVRWLKRLAASHDPCPSSNQSKPNQSKPRAGVRSTLSKKGSR